MMQPAASANAGHALALVTDLQAQLARALEGIGGTALSPVHWLRDDGRHGGGTRFVIADTPIFDRGSVNVSQVHYDDLPDKRLSSASALSTIVHPRHPRAPSMHMHLSWTEMRDGSGYWRMMADLNPAIPNEADTRAFEAALAGAFPDADLFGEAREQGDRYFRIPALDRHRGVFHVYLEGYTTEVWDTDASLARAIGESVIGCYPGLVAAASGAAPTEADQAQQLAYHTLYLFQVLSLDRGTTSGLMVHAQNDVGIMGSLPSRVDRDLLRSWADRVEAPQDGLVQRLADALPADGRVTVEVKAALAQTVRDHYTRHPEALALQASGNTVPPTVSNHR